MKKKKKERKWVLITLNQPDLWVDRHAFTSSSNWRYLRLVIFADLAWHFRVSKHPWWLFIYTISHTFIKCITTHLHVTLKNWRAYVVPQNSVAFICRLAGSILDQLGNTTVFFSEFSSLHHTHHQKCSRYATEQHGEHQCVCVTENSPCQTA